MTLPLTEKQERRLACEVSAKESEAMRRKAEMALLDRLRAEAAMPEWYPER
jgi:hypothetical protein